MISGSAKKALSLARKSLMLAVLVFVWLVFGMVYLDAFIPPFGALEQALMPWKGLYSIPVTSIENRLSFLEELLDRSDRVSNLSLAMIIVSFSLLSAYLTLLYQQKLRRSRENDLLVLKNMEISRRNEFIRYISATIGHEFKNNLGRIKRRIDLMEGLPDDAKRRVDENFAKLFADIDIFKKIADEREASLIEFHIVDIGRMLRTLAKQYGDLAEFAFGEGMPSPKIYASKTLLKTVFENIIDNAIKYKKPEQERARLSVALRMDLDNKRRYVSISFRDEGKGMNEEEAESCCYGAKSTQEGWGQGLYFAKYVIGLHAGRLRVGRNYTAPGVGTEIIIHLPFVEEALGV